MTPLDKPPKNQRSRPPIYAPPPPAPKRPETGPADLQPSTPGGLQAPTPAGLKRASPLFDRLLREVRQGALVVDAPVAAADLILSPALVADPPVGAAAQLGEATMPTNHRSNPPAAAAFGTRQYPLALALLPHAAAILDDPPQAAQQPPIGAPRVRAGVTAKARTAAEMVPQKLLEKTTQAALLWTGAQDASYFRVDFRDEFLQGVVCVVAVQSRRVQANFYVPDVDTRRLLEGESARLRANLEARGLKHAEVHVSLAQPPGDWPC